MKLTLESTEQICEILSPGLTPVPGRVWIGKTESGIPVQCLVTRIAVHKSERCEEFERELLEQHAPRPETLAWPLRMIL